MNNTKESSEVKTKNITLNSAVGWIVGILSFMSGLSILFSRPLSGISYLLITCIAIPPLSMRIQKRLKVNLSRSLRIILIITLFLYAIVSPGLGTPTSEVKNVSSNNKIQVISQVDKDKAKKDLDELMALSKKAGLVTSYEFSDSANVVYVSKLWYTQTVQFKKDFLEKVSILKESTTGYHRFEVVDAYSNDKVAEVTAFSGSLEVYK